MARREPRNSDPSLSGLRQKLIDADLCISTIRDRLGIIRRMIAWGVEHEMMAADTLQCILAIPSLRRTAEFNLPASQAFSA
jgi:hypothetical protein